MKELDEIAMGIADVTEELMDDSVAWQLAAYMNKLSRPTSGDEWDAIHSAVMTKAIEYMYLRTKMEYK